jgi:hypothetical protein
MYSSTAITKSVAFLMTLAILAPAQLSGADPVPVKRNVTDVCLGEDGTLQTQIVDFQGQPVTGEKVVVCFQNKPIASVISDQQGFATVSGLRPGPHQIVTARGTSAFRMWHKDNAPPSAVNTPTVVSDKDVVRGQLGAFNLPMLVVGGAAAAATVISLDAQDDAEDALAENALLRARVLALETASP